MQVPVIPIDSDKRELSSHGTYDFPVAIYNDQLDKNSIGFVNLHWHEEIQFSYVTKGKVEFIVNQKSYYVNEGEGIFINSECLHMAKPVDRPDSTFICINIHPRFLSSHIGSIIENKYIKPFISKNSLSVILLSGNTEYEKDILMKIISLINAFNKKEENYELEILIVTLQIFNILYSKAYVTLQNTVKTKSVTQERLKIILSYIHENFNRKIRLSEISNSANISTGECCRLFRNNKLQSPIEYLIYFRLNKSIELLESTTFSISDISEKVGFGSVSYFIEKFRKQVGCTPLDYRKAYLQKHIY